MAGPSRPSFPAPSEPSLRRLGVGGRGGGGGDRPLRAQLVIALVVGLILLGVPLYLMRRPSGTENAPVDGGLSDAWVVASDARRDAGSDGGGDGHAVKLGPVQRVKCSASPGSSGQEGALCDSLEFFEKALAESIRKNVACAPRTGKQGTLNYVLKIDFRNKTLGVFPGASGEWKGPQARRAATCVRRALPAPPWDTIQHQYRYYMIAIMATYPPPAPIPGPAGAPLFE